MHDTANAAAESNVHIYRATFTRIEGLRKRVAETAVTLDRATKEKKEAQGAFDSATMNLSAAVSDMIDEVNGVSKLPLFDNQSDAIARAEADPVAQKLLTRMLDHGISHLNALIVAGYTEEQRHELEDYLDAMDARKEAEAEGQAELLEAPVPPAFLAEQPALFVPSDEAIAALVNALAEQGLEVKPEHLARFSAEQWIAVETWLLACQTVKAEKGEALVMDDLPAAPSYLVNPAELMPAPEPEPEPAPRELTTEIEEAPKRSRAPRRSSATFKNSPRVVKGKKKAPKGRG